MFAKLILIILGVLIAQACGPVPAQTAYCEKQGGVVEERQDERGTYKVCVLDITVPFDDGHQTFSLACPLDDFYEGVCEDPDDPDRLEAASPPDPKYPLNVKLYDKVADILAKLKNTGYAHRPFVLDHSNTHYNLFLDCSGFVAHVLQNELPKHYAVLPKSYECAPNNRPLAADFYDYFHDVHKGKKQGCWEAIDDISLAQPGDVIVFTHPENIDFDNPVSCGDGTTIPRVTGNTGHVMFIYGHPGHGDHNASKYYVRVADSTSLPHTRDSRLARASYVTNQYKAWAAHSKKCGDGQYYYSYDPCGSEHSKTISHIHPSGVGAGTMYYKKDLSEYQWKSGAGFKKGAILIGRPIDDCD